MMVGGNIPPLTIIARIGFPCMSRIVALREPLALINFEEFDTGSRSPKTRRRPEVEGRLRGLHAIDNIAPMRSRDNSSHSGGHEQIGVRSVRYDDRW
jgi:hypothetical protein